MKRLLNMDMFALYVKTLIFGLAARYARTRKTNYMKLYFFHINVGYYIHKLLDIFIIFI